MTVCLCVLSISSAITHCYKFAAHIVVVERSDTDRTFK